MIRSISFQNMLISTCIILGIATNALASMEGYIVGGNFANIEQHAHSAFLSVNCKNEKGKSEAWICGASVVNQQILLSAAHCLHGCTRESHIGISIGDSIRTRGIKYSTYSFVIHEDYNTKTSANDICLVRVAGRLPLGKKINRVALMKSPPYGENAIVAGWGMTDEIQKSFTTHLKYVPQNVWNRNHCLQVFRYLVRGSICAANGNPDEYAAQGDSGSALVVRSYIQIGLVSYKIPAIARNVVVYTDVAYFYDWIKFYAGQLACL